MYKRSNVLKEDEDGAYSALLYRDNKYILISTPNTSHNPCFTFIINEECVSRISLLEPKYVECEYENYKLTKDEISVMIYILRKRPNVFYNESDLIIWKRLLKEQNFELEGMTDDQGNPFHIDENLPIPDYYQLLNS